MKHMHFIYLLIGKKHVEVVVWKVEKKVLA